MVKESLPSVVELDARRRWLIAKASFFIGTMAAATVTACGAEAATRVASYSPAPKSPNIPRVGFYEQDVMSPTLDFTQDLVVAQKIKDTGANTVEVRVDYTEPQSSDVGALYNVFCTSAQAIQMKSLNITANFQPHQRGGNSSWVPTTPTELKNFNTFVARYEDGLISKNSSLRCPNLKLPFKKFRFSIGGEPNYEPLGGPQYDASGNFIAPGNMVNLMASVAPAIQKEAKINNALAEVSMRSFTRYHGVINFVNQMGEVIKNEHIKWPKDIGVGVNGYWEDDTPDTVHPNLGYIGPADLPAFISAAINAYGYKPKIVVDEMGVEPFVPTDKINLYQKILPNSWVDEAGQAAQYREALNLYACAGVEEVDIFHLVDDYGANPWSRPGIIYPAQNPVDPSSYEKKSSYNDTSAAILDALNGNFQCAANKGY